MEVGATYISVIIILLVLIGFVLSIIMTLANTAGKRIQTDMSRVLSSYDYLIDQKMSKYNLEAENSEKRKAVNLLKRDDESTSKEILIKEKSLSANSFLRKEASYRVSSLAQGYDSIKNEFRDYAENVKEAAEKAFSETKRSDYENALLRLSEILKIEDVYELSIKSPEEQLGYFKKVLNPEDKIALTRYLATHSKTFSTIDFYDWIKISAMSVYQGVVVRSGNKNLGSDYDPSICEGCQIIVGDKIYDYSISKRDIQ